MKYFYSCANIRFVSSFVVQICWPGRYFTATDQRLGMAMSRLGQQKETKQFNLKWQEYLCSMNEAKGEKST